MGGFWLLRRQSGKDLMKEVGTVLISGLCATHSLIKEGKLPIRNGDGLLDLVCPTGIEIKVSSRLLLYRLLLYRSCSQHKLSGFAM